MLSLPQVRDVCLYYQHDDDTCRYLFQDDVDISKFYCLKQRPAEKDKIDSKLRTFMQDCKKSGTDPRTLNEPMGDNCPGYPLFKNKLQGYDVKDQS